MELKFAVCRYSDNIIGSSNRTFMELKFQSSNRLALSLLVLIVPLWNWNVLAYGKDGKGIECSNRTFMELKSEYASIRKCFFGF